MGLIKIHLDKNSFRPFLALLNKHSLHYTLGELKASVRTDRLFVSILQSAETWDKLPTVIIEFLDRPNRKVSITAKDGRRINARGLAHDELGWLVAHSKQINPLEEALEQTKFLAPEHLVLPRFLPTHLKRLTMSQELCHGDTKKIRHGVQAGSDTASSVS